MEVGERDDMTRQNNNRTSYPWMWCLYRMSVIIGGTLICLTSLYLGYLLIQQGATGEFTISGEKGDFKGFFSSISPGLGLAFLGCVVVIVSYVLQRKSWGSISHVKENTKRLNNTSANKAIDEHEE